MRGSFIAATSNAAPKFSRFSRPWTRLLRTFQPTAFVVLRAQRRRWS
jgi:hypothetical protein